MLDGEPDALKGASPVRMRMFKDVLGRLSKRVERLSYTTQGRASALQNIHVVLTVLYIKRVLEWNLKYYVYDLNDAYTWELMRSMVSEFLADLKSRRALEMFNVKVSATEYEKKIGRCSVKVDLKVVGAIEVIQVNLNVL